MKPKAILYYRVSSTEQADKGFSLEVQLEKMKHYCLLHEIEIKGVYVDEGISGRTMKKRPGLQNALASCEKGDIFMVMSLSRFARNTIESITMIDSFNKQGVEFVSLTEQFDTTTPIGKAVAGILSIVAQLESDQTSERVKAVKGYLKENKRRYVNKKWTPYGFIEKDGSLVRVPDEQKGLQVMRQMKDEGLSSRQIASAMNFHRFPPKRGGKRFYHTTVDCILNNSIHL